LEPEDIDLGRIGDPPYRTCISQESSEGPPYWLARVDSRDTVVSLLGFWPAEEATVESIREDVTAQLIGRFGTPEECGWGDIWHRIRIWQNEYWWATVTTSWQTDGQIFIDLDAQLKSAPGHEECTNHGKI
jgi:hypothetical protein